jgi:hypothetical protein
LGTHFPPSPSSPKWTSFPWVHLLFDHYPSLGTHILLKPHPLPDPRGIVFFLPPSSTMHHILSPATIHPRGHIFSLNHILSLGPIISFGPPSFWPPSIPKDTSPCTNRWTKMSQNQNPYLLKIVISSWKV